MKDEDSLREAQVKYLSWSSDPETINPNDKDYDMLSYAQKVSHFILEHLKEIAIKGMEEFSSNYGTQISLGNFGVAEQVRDAILQQKDINSQKQSGIADKSFGQICDKVAELYELLTEDMRLQDLEGWKTKLAKWKAQTEGQSSLQADDLHYATIVCWKAAFAGMAKIEAVHEQMMQDDEMLDQFIKLERLFWYVWLWAMRESML